MRRRQRHVVALEVPLDPAVDPTHRWSRRREQIDDRLRGRITRGLLRDLRRGAGGIGLVLVHAHLGGLAIDLGEPVFRRARELLASARSAVARRLSVAASCFAAAAAAFADSALTSAALVSARARATSAFAASISERVRVETSSAEAASARVFAASSRAVSVARLAMRYAHTVFATTRQCPRPGKSISNSTRS